MKRLYLLIVLSSFAFMATGQDYLANQYTGISNTPINDIVVENNSLLVATEQGLYRLQDFDAAANQIHQNAVQKISLDEDNQACIGLYSNKIATIKDNEIFSTGIEDNNMITAMLIDNHKIWIGTNDGLFMLSLKQTKETPHYRRENSKLVSNQIMDLELDEKGRLWIATDRGISIFDGRNWETLLEDKRVSAMENHHGNMWAAIEQTIQQFGEDQKWRAVAMPLNYSGQPIRDLEFDYKDNLWIATNQVLKYDTQSGVFSVFDKNSGFNSTMALCIEIDNYNQVWVGTAGNGLYKINNATLEKPLAFETPKKANSESTNETPKAPTKVKKERKRKSFNNAIATPNHQTSPNNAVKGSKESKSKTKINPRTTSLPKEYGKEKSNINFLGNRLIKEGVELDVTTMSIEIAIWDGQNADGDTVSLYYNGECILKEFSLTTKREYFTLDINPRTANSLVLYAHSQGKLGFTTATIAIDGKDQPTEWIVLNSDLKKCDRITFNFVY